jgi:hypothetical protein
MPASRGTPTARAANNPSGLKILPIADAHFD